MLRIILRWVIVQIVYCGELLFFGFNVVLIDIAGKRSPGHLRTNAPPPDVPFQAIFTRL